MSGTTLLIILLMIGLNALFAAYEIALASASVGRLKALADERRKGARVALLMKQNMEASLAVIQLGITVVGAIAAATGGANAEEKISPLLQQQFGISAGWADFLGLALVVVPLSALTIVCGELIPKVFAIKNKEWVCLQLSPTMRVMSLVFYPAVWALEGVVTKLMDWTSRRWQPRVEGQKTEVSEIDELRAVVALARTSRLIGGQEEKIILGAARLSSRRITEIMIPISEIVTLDLRHTMAESLVLAHTEMHTRFPVCAEPGNPQTICGYVNFKDIVSELRLAPSQPSLRGIMRSILQLSDDLSIATSLQRMTRGHTHIAIVRQADQSIVGMVTLEDILEELVGDIQDEYDRAPTHVTESGVGWVMGGGVSLDRVEQETGVFLDRHALPPGSRTLHDWVRAKLGRAVRGGDIVRDSGLRVLVRKVRRQQVMEAQISREEMAPKQDQPPPAKQEKPPLPPDHEIDAPEVGSVRFYDGP
jgi:putative hemolysin